MQRYKEVDISKGIGILLSIFGHLNYTFVHAFIYMFHMPLFYFISGFLFKPQKYTFKQFILRKLRTIVVPYFVLGAIIMAFDYFGHGKVQIVELLVQRRYLPLWFLTSLFFTEIIFYLLNNFISSNYLKGIIVVLLFLFGNILSNFIDTALPWNVDSVCFALVFYYFGYLFSKYKEKILNKKKMLMVSSIIILPTIFVIEMKIFGKIVDIFSNNYGIFPLNIVSALSGIVVVYCISIYIEKNKIISKILCYIGKNSLVFFALQGIPICSYVINLNTKMFDYSRVIYCVLTVIELICIIIILGVINEVLKITKIKKIL